ncbi:MAG: ABC transporter ATP-binding protein [Gammaproteobacteria bacterium]
MPVILEASGLNKRFGAVVAAADVSACVEKDSVVGLIGTNGAGKTTFVNMITGYLKPDSGTIAFKGSDITRLPPREITRRGICRSFQIPQLYNTLTVRENLGVGLGIVLRNSRKSLFGYRSAEVPGHGLGIREAADAMLERFGLARDRDRLAAVLPEGVRKLLDIAMALVVKPEILLLDEPTSGVSSDEKFEIMDRVMQAVRADGVTVLFVEHDMDIIARYAHRVMAFYEGRVLADGPAGAVLADEEVQRHVIGGKRAPGPLRQAEAIDARD